ncbi:MAG: carboxypeptidase-like regulatory domain-containing protein [bacterium]
MKTTFVAVTALLCGGWFLQVGCLDSPGRDNPLDPNSGKFENVGSVSGTTLTFFTPFKALGEVEVHMEPGAFVSKSNGQGQFRFDRVPAGKYAVTAQKDGYQAQPESLDVQVGQTATVQLNLDGLPAFNDFSVISCHFNRWWPQTDLFLLEITAQIDDPDGLNDVQLVQVEIAEMAFVDTLTATQTPGIFKAQIRESKLSGGNLHAVLGRKIVLKAHDNAGFTNVSQPKFLARVVDKVPEFDSPIGVTLQSSRPELKWKPMTLPFAYTFSVEVVRIDFNINTLVWALSDIDPAITSVTVPDSLVSGNYFWTIAAIDEFGNWSRAKEASFNID